MESLQACSVHDEVRRTLASGSSWSRASPSVFPFYAFSSVSSLFHLMNGIGSAICRTVKRPTAILGSSSTELPFAVFLTSVKVVELLVKAHTEEHLFYF